MAFAITEIDVGSNSYEIATTAVADGDTWRLRGAKTFITGVDEADAILVVAKTIEPDGLHRQAIPMQLITLERQFTLFLDDVVVPAEALVGPVGAGLRALFVGPNPERIAAAATANGIGRYALDRTAGYARERVVWGSPIGVHQGIAHPLAADVRRGAARPARHRTCRRFLRRTEGRRRGGEHHQARLPPTPHCSPSTPPSRPTAATA
jgi:alkylation response protein AidB-like acyl-CoA dehydrogenase